MESPSNLHPDDWERGLKAREIREEEWETHREWIRQMYLQEGVKIRDLRKTLWERWEFYATEAQYKKRLRIWRMEKNISKRKMAAIIQVADRRKAQGKDTIFAWHGLVLDEDKIERARKRFGNPPEASSSTETPSFVTYWTPNFDIITRPEGADDFVGCGRNVSHGRRPTPKLSSSPSIDVSSPELTTEHLTALIDSPSGIHSQAHSQVHSRAPSPRLAWLPSIFRPRSETPSTLEDPIADSELDKLMLEADSYWKANSYYSSPSQTLGDDDPETFAFSHKIGIAYNQLKYFRKARECFESAFAGRARVLGDEDPQTLDSLHWLGLTIYHQALSRQLPASPPPQPSLDLSDALHHLELAFQGRSKTLGDSHPDTLASLHSVGLILRRLHRLSAAQECFSRAVLGRESVLGPEARDTLDSLHELGRTCYHSRDHAGARLHLERCLDARKRVLGDEDPATLTTLHYLGVTYVESYEPARGRECLRRAYETRVKTLGEEHEDSRESFTVMESLLMLW